MFDAAAAAAGLAGLREPGRSVGVRAVARRAAADRSGVPARRVRPPERRTARIRGATPRRRRTASSISRAGIRSRPAAHPAGASAWGVEDLVGNGWEWTSTSSRRSPASAPMASYPEYSADFFDGEHFVMKGASPATARELLRPTFRNWFRPRYPYVYATFRCVTDIA